VSNFLEAAEPFEILVVNNTGTNLPKLIPEVSVEDFDPS